MEELCVDSTGSEKNLSTFKTGIISKREMQII